MTNISISLLRGLLLDSKSIYNILAIIIPPPPYDERPNIVFGKCSILSFSAFFFLRFFCPLPFPPLHNSLKPPLGCQISDVRSDWVLYTMYTDTSIQGVLPAMTEVQYRLASKPAM